MVGFIEVMFLRPLGSVIAPNDTELITELERCLDTVSAILHLISSTGVSQTRMEATKNGVGHSTASAASRRPGP